MSKTIEKKILPEYFDRIAAGEKTYELRLADWKCEKGDTLILVEIDAKTQKPTGRTLRRKVGYVGKTKGLNFWTGKEIDEHGYQIISLLNELPVVRIKDAWLLRENASKYLHELWGKDTKLADDDWMEWKVGEYKKAWQPYEQKILLGMTETLGLSFRQNIIDVNIAPWFGAFSDPMVIGVMREPDVFIDTLTHELLHRLLTDNSTVPYETALRDEWQKLFGKQHTFRTLVHIPVHAVHKAIYLDVLKDPKRLERDIANNKQYEATDYIAAWGYVENHDYEEIIKKIARIIRKVKGAAMTERNLEQALSITRSAVVEAGQELKQYFGNVEAKTKGDGSSVGGVVTELDHKTEHFLAEKLGVFSSDIGFRGEEFGVRSQADTTWLVDPIDGTAHFIRGIPFCTTMVALVENGEVVLSVIHDFVRDDTYWATRGGGAFRNNKPISVSQRSLKQSLISFETHLDKPKNFAKYLKVREHAGIIATISCGFEFAMIASGKLDGRIGLDPYGMDWDFAPGSLLVSEAGGRATNIGKDTYDYQNHDFIIANPVIHQELTSGTNAIFPMNQHGAEM